MKSKLAIITINLNNFQGLQRTINSVINQSYKDFQFIVIDGDSKDGSKNILKEFHSCFYYCVSEADKGVYDAMNKGINATNAEYLLFLNSGDWLNDNHVIERMIVHLHSKDIICGDINIFDKDKWHYMHSENTIELDLFLRLSLYHQATFISKSLFDSHGNYDTSFKSTGDFEFFIRVLLVHNASYVRVPITVSNFIADGMSNDVNMTELNLKERRKSWEKHFSKGILQLFDEYYKLMQSDEFTLAKRINKRLPF